MSALPTPILRNAGHEENLYRGRAMAELRILKQQMNIVGLKLGSRKVDFGNGVTCFCNICFGIEEAFVYLPKGSEEEIYRGSFVCLPRSGNRVLVGYNDGSVTRYYEKIDSAGFAADGTPISIPPAYAYAYPRQDNSIASVFLTGSDMSWTAQRQQAWSGGNIDWIGQASNPTQLDQVPTLTWLGPPSRYFPQVSLPEGINLGPNIYENGTIKATLPLSGYVSYYEQQAIPYFVLGAAQTTDQNGQKWLSVVCREYYLEYLGEVVSVYANMAVMVKPYSSTSNAWYSEQNTAGWQRIYDDRISHDGTTLSVPVFFNSAGTIAKTIQGSHETTVSIDIDNLTASVLIEDSVVTGTRDQIGSPATHSESGNIYVYTNQNPGTYGYIDNSHGVIQEQTTKAVAVDWKNNAWVYAYVDWEFDIVGDVTNTLDMNRTDLSDYGSRSVTSEYTGVQTGQHTATSILRIGSDSFNLASHSMSQRIEARNSQAFNEAWSINDGPPPPGYHITYSNLNHSVSWIMSAVLYLDIRHNTILLNTMSAGSETTSRLYSNYSINGVQQTPPNHETFVNHDTIYETTMVHSSGVDTVNGYDYTLLDSSPSYLPTLTYPLVFITENTTTTDSQFQWFLSSNQPVCSFAVNKYGQYFYSVLCRDVVLSSLNGADPSIATALTGENKVYFPISPA